MSGVRYDLEPHYPVTGGAVAAASTAARLGPVGRYIAGTAAYAGPLLVESEVMRIEDARIELAAALRRGALNGTTGELWAWLETDHGRDDPEAMELFLQRASERDPHRDVITARLRSLRRSWELD